MRRKRLCGILRLMPAFRETSGGSAASPLTGTRYPPDSRAGRTHSKVNQRFAGCGERAATFDSFAGAGVAEVDFMMAISTRRFVARAVALAPRTRGLELPNPFV